MSKRPNLPRLKPGIPRTSKPISISASEFFSKPPTIRQTSRANNRLIQDEKRIAIIRHKLATLHDNTESRIRIFINQQRNRELSAAAKLNSRLVFLSIPHASRDYAGMRATRKTASDANKALRAEARANSVARSQSSIAKRAAALARKQDSHLVTSTEAKVLRTVDKSIRSGRRISKDRFAYLSDLVRVENIRFPDY